MLATGNCPGYFRFLLHPNSLATALPSLYNQLCEARETCLWPVRGCAANANRSLTIPELERKHADLRLENPAKSHAQTSYSGTAKEYDLN